MPLFKRAIALVFTVACTAGIIIGFSGVAYSPKAPIIISTRDEATSDQATRDEATKDEVVPTLIAETIAPTEPPTEIPTEIPTEPCETEAKESVDISYDVVDDEPDDDSNVTDEVYDEEPNDDSDDRPALDTTDYSDSDLNLLARVIWAEAGDCSEECQWLVASTTMNLAEEMGDGTLESIVYNTNIVYISYSEPDSQCYRVAARVLSGDRDYRVKAFRLGKYHDFGTPYTVVDNVYFSTF